jgi:hypothetical protein
MNRVDVDACGAALPLWAGRAYAGLSLPRQFTEIYPLITRIVTDYEGLSGALHFTAGGVSIYL